MVLRPSLAHTALLLAWAPTTMASVVFSEVCGVEYKETIMGPARERQWKIERINDGKQDVFVGRKRFTGNMKSGWPNKEWWSGPAVPGDSDYAKMRESNAEKRFPIYGLNPSLKLYDFRTCR